VSEAKIGSEARVEFVIQNHILYPDNGMKIQTQNFILLLF
jgi:hypothetical protein